MDKDDFNALVATMQSSQRDLLQSKGDDYTRHDPDRLANFKKLATDLDIQPLTVWAVYAGKHWDAIMSYIKTGKVESESILERFLDLQNYLYLGYALYKEIADEDIPF